MNRSEVKTMRDAREWRDSLTCFCSNDGHLCDSCEGYTDAQLWDIFFAQDSDDPDSNPYSNE